MADGNSKRPLLKFLFAPLLIVALLGGAVLYQSQAEDPSAETPRYRGESSQDLEARDPAFGLPRAAISEADIPFIPDLYSPELTDAPSEHSWRSKDTDRRLEVDRIVPVSAALEMGAQDWNDQAKLTFGSDRANFSVTSHQANGWKASKTPADILRDSRAGEFSWSDDCAESYDSFLPQGFGCEGVPSDFDRCGYSEGYSKITDHYGLKVPRADESALEELSEGC